MLIADRNGMMVRRGEIEILPRSYMKVIIPTDAYDFRLNYAGSGTVIDWGDGATTTPTSSPAQHTYTAGEYTIEISDACTSFECPASYGRTTITEVGFGNRVTSLADGAYNGATSLIKIACAPSVAYAVNNAFNNCTNLDWVCDFPLLNLAENRFAFLPRPSRQISYMGTFASQKYPCGTSGYSFYICVLTGDPNDMVAQLPSLLYTGSGSTILQNLKVRRIWLPSVKTINIDAFYNLPNLYGVYAPNTTQISSSITRSSSQATNNPLGVTHLRLGHLVDGYTPELNRTLCWGGSENYLGVFMVDMTRAELADWLANLSVANFISQNAFNNKAICTDDPEWNTWNAWFEGGMQINSVPTFPLNR